MDDRAVLCLWDEWGEGKGRKGREGKNPIDCARSGLCEQLKGKNPIECAVTRLCSRRLTPQVYSTPA